LPGTPAGSNVPPGPLPQQLKLKGTTPMLMTIAIILIALWLLGLVTSTTLGGFIHILLVVAVIVVLVKLIQGRKVL